jgi:hypothetical protein
LQRKTKRLAAFLLKFAAVTPLAPNLGFKRELAFVS